MKKNAVVSSAQSQGNPAPATVDPKAELKALTARRKELREQVKQANEAAKAQRASESKEVTLRWIKNFTDRIGRLEAKAAKAATLRQGLIDRARKNGWIA